jgi:phage terminase Nu1 subunit (DNA packaging protein)
MAPCLLRTLARGGGRAQFRRGGRCRGDLTAERARLSKLQADKVEIELAELRGEVVRGEDVARVMQAHIMGARARLLSLPTKRAVLSRRAPGGEDRGRMSGR